MRKAGLVLPAHGGAGPRGRGAAGVTRHPHVDKMAVLASGCSPTAIESGFLVPPPPQPLRSSLCWHRSHPRYVPRETTRLANKFTPVPFLFFVFRSPPDPKLRARKTAVYPEDNDWAKKYSLRGGVRARGHVNQQII